MKGGKHSRMTVELTRLYFHYFSSTSFKLKWLQTTFCPHKHRRCINLSLLWVFCHCLVPSSHVSSSDRPYVLQCCFVRVGRREDLCEEPALIMHELQLPGERTTRLAEMERGADKPNKIHADSRTALIFNALMQRTKSIAAPWTTQHELQVTDEKWTSLWGSEGKEQEKLIAGLSWGAFVMVIG